MTERHKQNVILKGERKNKEERKKKNADLEA